MERIYKSVLSGIILSIAVIVLHAVCTLIFPYGGEVITPLLFAFLMLIFLPSEKLYCLFIKGFAALFLMFFLEIIFLIFKNPLIFLADGELWLKAYVFGLYGSAAGVILSILCTVLKVTFFPIKFIKEDFSMIKSAKINLLLYFIFSSISFTYLVLPENSALGVFLFAILQPIAMFFCIPDKKRLWLYAPIIIFGLNAFLSANTMWRIPNFYVSIFILGFMFIDFNMRDTSLDFIRNTFRKIISPLKTLTLPFSWVMNFNKEKTPVVKRIAIAIAITLPSIIVLIALLSGADMIFSKGVSETLSDLSGFISFNAFFKIILGICAGLYLFGVVYSAHQKSETEQSEKKSPNGDLLILNILLGSILIVYTIFVIIQFRYLFAGNALPFGLTYTEYARKGFFELLFLSGINIALILLTVYLTRKNPSRLLKILCCYLCIVTFVLLASSFYRMWLYSDYDGLTRLRFMVFGFLIFESIGLLFTFIYILKPRFNITAVYMAIATVYYCTLNLVHMDYIIAENQIDKLKKGEREDIAYIFTLSPDAAIPISRLDDEDLTFYKDVYFNKIMYKHSQTKPRFQRYNLSLKKAVEICR